MTRTTEPTRDASCWYDDNGKPHYRSSLSPKSVQVRAECKHPPHHPGIIIFVHGVNSTGEWYASAESALCAGLNIRLGLKGTSFALTPNIYNCDDIFDLENYKKDRTLLNPGEANSPVIRFYWGYRSPDGEEDKYKIPLVNRQNEDYHELKAQGLKPDALRAKGPWFWGGGPFQNGTNQLVSLWGETGFEEKLPVLPESMGLKVQDFAPDLDRLLTNAPPRKYYAHAAKRLADLLNLIRQTYPRDTVSVISHSQGTMVAMAATALAEKAPDALFILNSPYAMETKFTDTVTLPDSEVLTDKAREQTLSAIINKVAERATALTPDKYGDLFVGKSADNKPWRPDIKHKSSLLHTVTTLTPDGYEDSGKDYPKVKLKQTEETTSTEKWIAERDNHGRFYIYCNPHDRVMGSSPLLSLGWQGLPNTPVGQKPHHLLKSHDGHLFQRMMARATPCGAEPNPQTAFWPLPDGRSFWDDGDQFLTYSTPETRQTLDINAEEVPSPILASEMVNFDEKRPKDGEKYDRNPQSPNGTAWGQSSKRVNKETRKSAILPNDDTFRNFVLLYPKKMVPSGRYRQGSYGAASEPIMRLETDDERRIRVGSFVSQPTDHSTLPNHQRFMTSVVSFDLPVGFCDATWDKAFMAKLRDVADWTKGYDNYFNRGELSVPPIPAIISTETASDKFKAELAKAAADRGYGDSYIENQRRAAQARYGKE